MVVVGEIDMTVEGEETFVVVRKWDPGRRVTVVLAELEPGTTTESYGENVVRNGLFENGVSEWKLNPTNSGTVVVRDDGSHSTAAKVTITAGGSTVQFYQDKLPLMALTEYELAFYGRSNAPRLQKVILIQHATPNANVGVNQTIQMTDAWQLYTIRFTTAGDIDLSNCRLRFPLAGLGEWYFDDVRIAPITKIVTNATRRERSRVTIIPTA